MKPVDEFLTRWEAIEKELESRSQPPKIMIVGGGAGGVELALSLQFRLRQTRPNNLPEFHLVTGSSGILPSHNTKVQKLYRRIIQEREITLTNDSAIARVEENRVFDRDGKALDFDYLFWVTQASAPGWIKASGIAVDDNGFMAVDEYLQSVSHSNVFAAGDVASMIHTPRPKSGVYAVRQGPPLTANLRAAAQGEALTKYNPQKRFLSLISTGDKFAIASRGGWAAQGKWVWRWKDHIDREFMRRFQELPEMSTLPPAKPSAAQSKSESHFSPIRCVGCGSKIGPSILSRVISRLSLEKDPKIALGLDSPDDAAAFSIPPGQQLVQTVDYLPAFLSDPWLFGRIAATHSLSDIIAMGAKPHSAQVVITIPYSHATATEETLFQALSGANAVLRSHGATLIGGHSLEGTRLEMGLVINGLGETNGLFTKRGLKPGDDLILTKPIGTGIILAAVMRRIGASTWRRHAIESMLKSNITAIEVLRNWDIKCVTDITGFGLAGHLAEMVEASEVQAELFSGKIPLLPGTEDCAKQGISSSLLSENQKRVSVSPAHDSSAVKSMAPILFDPQTSGGLLFGIPSEQTAPCLQQLQSHGWPQAAVVGRIHPTKEGQAEITLSP